MKERPIIFSAPMVRAILDGRKAQTRRVVKFPLIDRNFGCELAGGEIGQQEAHDLCPYGQPGDRLWVREAFMPAPMEVPPESPSPTRWNIAYAAGGQTETEAPAGYDPMLYNYERWSPSIHMPRWASRITLEVVSVRVERVQEIDFPSIRAEGVDRCKIHNAPHTCCSYLREEYRLLWDSLNAARGHGWQTNPWVWAVEFRRVEP